MPHFFIIFAWTVCIARMPSAKPESKYNLMTLILNIAIFWTLTTTLLMVVPVVIQAACRCSY